MKTSKPLHILIYSIVYYPRFVGGAEIALKEITGRIGRDQAVFDMITLRIDPDLPRFEHVGNVNVHRVGFSCGRDEKSASYRRKLAINKYLFPIFSLGKAFSLHARQRYDLVWAMMANYSGFGALAFKLTHHKTPFLLTLQEGDSYEHILGRVGIFSPFYRMIFSFADHIQCISAFLVSFAKKMHYQGPATVIPNGVDTKIFSTKTADTEQFALKESLGKKYYDRFIITTSRLVKKNAIDVLIRALLHVPREVKLLIIGEGEEKTKLESLVQELQLEQRVVFKGFVPHADLPKYLQISDVFARPSRSEGFGNSFIEAMAARIPVVGTPVGGIIDFLYDPEKNPTMKSTGIFCEVDDPKSLADAIMKCLDNLALRNNMTDNAYEMVIERYEWSSIAGRMNTLFHEVAKSTE